MPNAASRYPGKVIDGRACAAGLRERVSREVERLESAQGLRPGLAVVLVGDDPASQVYVRSKGRHAEGCGMRTHDHRLPADLPEAELLSLIAALNGNPEVHGILVQLPLPGQIDAAAVIDAIDPAKDVDGLHPVNAGRLASGQLAGPRAPLIPCTPLGSLLLLKDRLGDLVGLKALVLGRSSLVGRPLAQLLLSEHCTVTIAHSRTRELADECRAADVLVAAVGRPELVRGDWIKPGATVIDVGINRVPAPTADEPERTRLVGDVAFAEAVEVAGAITPVPGGVGPMTIACLLANTLTAACRQLGHAPPAILG
ncbi:MAG: bifunctional methylenetetrahydrofolate dehydrogenase/methenyltetrahydrofolate cyclohydrolase FolD [Alphaproteobacteria bacterium]